MSAEVQLVIDVWEAVRDHLPPNRRVEAAFGIMRALAEYGLEAADLGDVEDEDADLAEAFGEVFGEAREEDYDEKEDDA